MRGAERPPRGHGQNSVVVPSRLHRGGHRLQRVERGRGLSGTNRTFDDLSDFLPAWSPDGRNIVFSSFRNATLEENPDNSEIYTMRADGSHLANLTQNLAFDAGSDWQPLDHHHGHDDHHGDDG